MSKTFQKLNVSNQQMICENKLIKACNGLCQTRTKILTEMDKLLSSIYYNYKEPGSLASADKLYKAAVKVSPRITKKPVTDWLSTQDAFTLHKRTVHKFTRNRVLVSAIDEEFQADLMDIRNVSRQNGGYRYLLNVIDVLSKFAFSIPVKRKSGPDVAAALRQVFEKRVPSKLHSDRGLEFQNEHVAALVKEFGVFQTFTKDKLIKASVVERFNRTLRMKIARLATHTGTSKFINELPSIIDAYNNSKHRSIKMKPVDVNIENQDVAFKNLYNNKTYLEMLTGAQSTKPKFQVGDFVRLKIEKQLFVRGYAKNWTDQVFRINRIISTGQVHTYYIRDSMNNELSRKFYLQELQKISPPTNIVKEITGKRRRTVDGVLITEYRVAWQNSTDQTWIPESDLFNINLSQ